MKLGFQGIPGSYSDTAVQHFLKRSHYLSEKSIECLSYDHFIPLVDALHQGQLDFAVVPVENSTTGIITRTMDLFRHKHILAVDQWYQSINHQLLALPGASIQDLREIYSHPEALSQTQSFIRQHPWLVERPYTDTAMSAKKVAQDGLLHQAALASKRAGDLYGLVALASDIQNEKTNQTRFLLLTASPKIDWQDVKGERLLLYVETSHQPGALFNLLQVFNVFHCNLEALNARPISNRPFIYGFFIEINLKDMIGSIGAMGDLINYHTNYFQIIGHFQQEQVLI